MRPKLELFTTCPPNAGPKLVTAEMGPAYRDEVQQVARWSEAAGCKGILVYTDNRLVDPWLTAHLIIQATETLAPLVAVQPIYMHPYTAAKMAATFGLLYGRKIYLNMVAGGFIRDLDALNDFTPHDPRYDRLVEYTKIVQGLAANSMASIGLSHDAPYYKVNNLKLTPPLPPELQPTVFVSGSSAAGQAAAEELGAVSVQYPQPQSTYPPIDGAPTGKMGIRIGVLAREDADEAWRVAEARFPADRRGEIAHQLAMRTSDSSWHRSLSEWPEMETDPDTPYWLRPFQSYRTFCPYLVGSYERVAVEISAYIRAGFTTYILDVPPDEEELHLIRKAFDMAEAAAAT